MRRTHLILLLAVVAGPLDSTTAAADAYLAIEGTSLSVEDIDSDDLNPLGARLRLGLRLSELFDIEGQFGLTRDDDNVFRDTTEIRTMGGYLKAYVPIGERSALFGTAGYATVDIDVSESPNGPKSDAYGGLSWGFGLETRLTDRIDLTADFTRFEVDEEDFFPSVSTLNAGIKVYF